ncbi:MAG: branched-chain amino acid ABC transporter permease [Synergistaceae bacterium]|nr:branched-chain amino acid ABC transporter permease [Synergistaceae bacterium]MBQ6738908.1 branched-chain amino acid ABC transporter permease [Synergistaceae bacterium]MBQ7067719.1 branched-chain amino acid ABC transporter permease [Synergistaceae bacterium]MBR0253345.1 branched-chain amino acid ABC transporter permease [Synergistaceae bacterium]
MKRNIILILIGLALALWPLGGYQEGIIILMCINCVAAMGVSILTGFTGIFTLGHAAYMALGAYTAAILTVRYGVSVFPSILAGGFMAILVAWLIGLPTLKLTGDYYAIASLGLCEAIRLILENWQSFTRGSRGFPGIEPYTTRGFAVTIFIFLAIITFNFLESRLGRELKASRDDGVAASLMGFDTHKSKMKALVISAFYCGISGALLGGYMGFIQPSMFDMMKSTELTAVVVFGGLGSLSGTILGSAAITLIMEYFRDISQYRMLIYGLLLVIIMVFRPEGLLGSREIWDLKMGVKK